MKHYRLQSLVFENHTRAGCLAFIARFVFQSRKRCFISSQVKSLGSVENRAILRSYSNEAYFFLLQRKTVIITRKVRISAAGMASQGPLSPKI